MKTYKVINQNGLLFNQENNKRLILREQHEFVITADDQAFEEDDSLNREPKKLRNTDEMFDFVNKKYEFSNIRKLYKAGQHFVFRVGLGTKKKEDESVQFYFLCRILEDLYSYQRDEKKFPRCCKCQCIVEDCVSKNLSLFEPVYADSLNKVSSNTITHYFALKRSSAINVFNEFKPVDELYSMQASSFPEVFKTMKNLGSVVKSVYKL